MLVDPEDININFGNEVTNAADNKPYITAESFFKNPKF